MEFPPANRNKSNASPPYKQYYNFAGEQTGVSHHSQAYEGTVVDNRMSDKERPYSPLEIVSPMPESYRSGTEEKEVVIPPVQPDEDQRPEGSQWQRRRICGIPLIWFWAMLAAIAVLAIALGVGLGVGLSNNDK